MYVQFCTFVDLRANSFGCLIMMMDYSHEIFSLYIFYFMFCLGSDRWCQLMWPTTQLTTASRPARRSASWSCLGWPPSSDLSQQHHPIMGEACDLTATSSITFRWGVWRHSNIIQSRSGEAWFHISLILCESWRLSNITNHVDNKYKKG